MSGRNHDVREKKLPSKGLKRLYYNYADPFNVASRYVRGFQRGGFAGGFFNTFLGGLPGQHKFDNSIDDYLDDANFELYCVC